jgi:hypothetical protein
VLRKLTFFSLISINACLFTTFTYGDNAIKVAKIHDEVKYSYNFDHDSVNFTGTHYGYKAVTDKWLVLVNFHGEAELNTSNTYDPNKRTLQWGAPYSYAAKHIHDFTAIHEKLALLKAWSQGKAREFVTFVLVPPRSEIFFKFGIAGTQIDQTTQERQEGGGKQLRLLNVPIGTICISLKINPTAAGTFDVETLFQQALQDYNITAKLTLDSPKILMAAKAFKMQNFKDLHLLARIEEAKLDQAIGNAKSIEGKFIEISVGKDVLEAIAKKAK